MQFDFNLNCDQLGQTVEQYYYSQQREACHHLKNKFEIIAIRLLQYTQSNILLIKEAQSMQREYQLSNQRNRLPEISLRPYHNRQYSDRYFKDPYHSNNTNNLSNKRYSRYTLKQHVNYPTSSFDRYQVNRNINSKNMAQSFILPQTHREQAGYNRLSSIRRLNTEGNKQQADSPQKFSLESLAHSMMRRFPQKHHLKRQDLGYDQVKLKQYVTEQTNDKQYIQNRNMLQRFHKEAQQRRKNKLKAHLKQGLYLQMPNSQIPITLRIKTEPNEDNTNIIQPDQPIANIQQIPDSPIQPDLKQQIKNDPQNVVLAQNPQYLPYIFNTKESTIQSKQDAQCIKLKLKLLKQKNKKTEAKYAYVKKKLKNLQSQEIDRIQSNEQRLQRIQEMLSSIVVKIQENDKIRSSALLKRQQQEQEVKQQIQKNQITVNIQDSKKQKEIVAFPQSQSIMLQSVIQTKQQFCKTIRKRPKVVYSVKERDQTTSMMSKINQPYNKSVWNHPLDRKLQQLRSFHKRLQICQQKRIELKQ